jgi:hypothetical protein
MQSIGHISLVVTGSALQDQQLRIQEAERLALVKMARSGQPSMLASFRYAIGQFMVGFGRKVAGCPRCGAKPIDVPGAVRIAR